MREKILRLQLDEANLGALIPDGGALHGVGKQGHIQVGECALLGRRP